MSARVRRFGRAIRENLGTILAVTSIAFTVVYVHYVNREFCQVISPFAAAPAARPADPASAPAQENQYEWHQRFTALGRSLGC